MREEKIDQMPEDEIRDAYAVKMGGVKPRYFQVVKETGGDGYAVLKVNPLAPETGHRIAATIYDRNNAEVGRAWYTDPEEGKKYIDLQDALFVKGVLYLCTFEYNTKAAGGESSAVVLSQLATGNNEFQHSSVAGTGQLSEQTNILMRYMPATKRLALLMYTLMDERYARGGMVKLQTYALVYGQADISDLKMRYFNSVSLDKLDAYAATHLDRKREMERTVMDLRVDEGDQVAIFLEETASINNTSVGLPAAGDIDVLHMSDAGDVASANIYRMRQDDGKPHMFRLSYRDHKSAYISGRSRGLFAAPDGFLSFQYLVAASGTKYILFNDDLDNLNIPEDKTPHIVKSVSASNLTAYRISADKTEKLPVLGLPDETFDNRFAMTSCSDYDPATGRYVVLIVEKKRRAKSAKLAWAELN